MKRLLLVSNSTQHGRGYLDHVESELRSLIGRARRVLFAPFALFDREAYVAKARTRFQAMGYELEVAGSRSRGARPRSAERRRRASSPGDGRPARV